MLNIVPACPSFAIKNQLHIHQFTKPMKKLLSLTLGIASLLCFETSQAKTVKTTVVHDAAGIPYSLNYIKQNHRDIINRINQQQNDYDINLTIFDAVYNDSSQWTVQFIQGGNAKVLEYTTDNNFDHNGTVIGNLPDDSYEIMFYCMDNSWGRYFNIEADWIDDFGVQRNKSKATQAWGDNILGVRITNGCYIYIDRYYL